jgi:anti-sigma regulatory factor (Ser/Thr protein kinase)
MRRCERAPTQAFESSGMEQMRPARYLKLHDEPSSSAQLREAVDEVATRALPDEARFELKVAATEALANALKRASPERRPVDVALLARGDAIEIEVRGRGEFRLDYGADSDRGRGLPLMVALVDEVEFVSTEEGTRVRIRKRVTRKAA